VFKVDPSWESGLQVAAKLSWLLPLNPPLDYVAFRDLVHHVMPSGVPVSPEGFVALFLGHCLKWPPAVVVYRHNLSEVEGMTSVYMLSAFWAAVRAMDGQELPHMHERMSGKGRMHSHTGLVVHSQWVGLIRKEDSSVDSPVGSALRLGKDQKAFVAVDGAFDDAVLLLEKWVERVCQADLSVLTRMHFVDPCVLEAGADIVLDLVRDLRQLQVGRAGPLRWPTAARGAPVTQTTAGELPDVAEAATAKRRRQRGTPGAAPGILGAAPGTPGARAAPGTPGARAARRADGGYLPKHFTRALLLAMDDLFWHVSWDKIPWTMSTVLKWSPDEQNNCEPIQDMMVSEVAKRFASSPFWVSCWACFGGDLPPEELELIMAANDRNLLHVAHNWWQEMQPLSAELVSDQLSPAIQTFIEALASHTKACSQSSIDKLKKVKA
jgi:hypothetical protein